MFTREMLMRFNVVAAYHRYDSVVPKSLIQPDHRTKQMIEKERKVSMVRRSLGLQRSDRPGLLCNTQKAIRGLRGGRTLLPGPLTPRR
jgi:hypothetical protein